MSFLKSLLKLFHKQKRIEKTRFYHIHTNGNYDEMWQEGKILNISSDNPFWTFAINYVPNGQTIDHLREYQMLIRELGLEYIREKKFPNYPSRKHCIWLVGHKQNQLDYWIEQLKENEVTLFEVETLGGKLFKGRNALLPIPSNSFKEIIEKSLSYWQCNQKIEYEDEEYLYEGKIKIIKKIPKPRLLQQHI